MHFLTANVNNGCQLQENCSGRDQVLQIVVLRGGLSENEASIRDGKCVYPFPFYYYYYYFIDKSICSY